MSRDNGFAKAQAAYEAREAPEYYEDEEGGCDHHWVHRGTAPDGTTFVRCTKCGLQAES